MRKFKIYESNGEYAELSAPLKIYYDITTNCNLDCEFCFKGSQEIVKTSLEIAKGVIDEIANSQVMDVVFLGGEPLMCPFLFDAIEYAKERGINVGIITNGTLFTSENVKKLKKLVNNSISVSIHAHTNELHDEISRGEKVLDEIICGLKLLNQEGIKPELAFTPLKKNVHHLYDTISNVLNNGIQISDVLVNRLIPSGNAIEAWADKEVTLNEQQQLFAQMDRLCADFPDLHIATGDAIPFCMVEEKHRKYIIRCDYAITLGWINERNLFGKCMCRGSTRFDSLDGSSIKKLWKESDAFLEHRRLRSIPKECRECEWISLCGGGCACSSYDKDVAQDAYFNKASKFEMPKLNRENTEHEKTGFLFGDDDIVRFKQQFIIRKENDFTTIYDEIFLLIPLSSGAIIQDVIQPEDGYMLWINSIEKQISIYLQADHNVFTIGKRISYEFGLPLEESLAFVRDTIDYLARCEMVIKHEC